MSTMSNRSYIDGLDGLRAFAILFVVFYHFSFAWAKGGFLGVDIFFVLSGYLATSKILSIREDFNVKAFLKNRLCRILPSAYLMITVTVLYVVLFNHELSANIMGDAISSVLYATNWWFIFHKLSYFDSFGSPSPLKHIWFLAVQEQFYIIWPLILMKGLKISEKNNLLLKMIFILAVLSAALMGILYDPTADPSRIYYGTDTRAFELLAGSFLAVVLANKNDLVEEICIKNKNLLNIIGIIAFLIFIYCGIFIDEYSPFLFRGGLFLFSLNTALLIACICHGKGILDSMLSWRPLRWIGTRSYGIYLWHYPVMVLSTPVYEIGNPSWYRVLLQLIITCIAAELSYRYIELPVRKLGIKGYFKYLYAALSERKLLPLAKKTLAIISVLVIMMLIGITDMAKTKSSTNNTETCSSEISTSQITEDKTIDISPSKKDMSIPVENMQPGPVKFSDIDSDEQNPAASDKPNEGISPSENKAYNEILAIGDSIMIDIAPNLNEKYDNITIDGKVARQMSEAISLVPKYAAFNASDKAVIIELGTNGYFTDKQINELLDSFSKSHIFLINTRVPRSWENKVNEMLKEESKERENVTLIDWYSVASKHPEYFGRDGVHLTSKGAKALVDLIAGNLEIK